MKRASAVVECVVGKTGMSAIGAANRRVTSAKNRNIAGAGSVIRQTKTNIEHGDDVGEVSEDQILANFMRQMMRQQRK